jgi:hypothetical protein
MAGSFLLPKLGGLFGGGDMFSNPASLFSATQASVPKAAADATPAMKASSADTIANMIDGASAKSEALATVKTEAVQTKEIPITKIAEVATQTLATNAEQVKIDAPVASNAEAAQTGSAVAPLVKLEPLVTETNPTASNFEAEADDTTFSLEENGDAAPPVNDVGTKMTVGSTITKAAKPDDLSTTVSEKHDQIVSTSASPTESKAQHSAPAPALAMGTLESDQKSTAKYASALAPSKSKPNGIDMISSMTKAFLGASSSKGSNADLIGNLASSFLAPSKSSSTYKSASSSTKSGGSDLIGSMAKALLAPNGGDGSGLIGNIATSLLSPSSSNGGGAGADLIGSMAKALLAPDGGIEADLIGSLASTLLAPKSGGSGDDIVGTMAKALLAPSSSSKSGGGADLVGSMAKAFLAPSGKDGSNLLGTMANALLSNDGGEGGSDPMMSMMKTLLAPPSSSNKESSKYQQADDPMGMLLKAFMAPPSKK